MQSSTRNATDQTAMKTITAFIGACWLSLPTAFQGMLILGTFDVLTSLLNHKVKFRRRVTIISLSWLLALMVHTAMWYAKKNTDINLGFDITSGVCVFYAIGSAIQVILNFAEAGVPVPPVLVGLMLKAKGLTANEQQELEKLNTNHV